MANHSMSCADLSGLDLSSLNLSGADLTATNLTPLVLKGEKVQGVNGLPSAVGLEPRGTGKRLSTGGNYCWSSEYSEKVEQLCGVA